MDRLHQEGYITNPRGKAKSVVFLRAPASAITLLRRGKQESGSPAAEVEVHYDGIVLDAYLPPGPAQIRLRALGGRTLSGTATLTVTPVTAIGEGLGPPPEVAQGFMERRKREEAGEEPEGGESTITR